MKKPLIIILISVLTFSLNAQEKKVKTGWKFGGALPAITFDSDLGFQYGALAEFFNYGNPSVYPDYLDHIYTEASRFTKGSGIYRIMYESNHLFKKIQWVSDLSYLPDQAYNFYGFNGYESVYNKDWMDQESDIYRSRMFYRYERNLFRIKNDFQGKIGNSHFKWSAGFAFQNFDLGSVNIEKLNKGKEGADLLPTVEEMPGLFERYQALGLISNDQSSGGWVNTLKAGIMFDTRDNRPNPMKGLWTEMGLETAPDFMGNNWNFTRFYFIHRQYFTLIEKDLSFVYRLGYQTALSGEVPFFYQTQVITSRLTGATSEGLGGSKTLRGVLRNRVMGDGFVMGNVELRWKPVYFRFLNQDCYLGLDAFYDFGMVTKKAAVPSDLESKFNALYSPQVYEPFTSGESKSLLANPTTNITAVPTEKFSDFFNPGSEKLHMSAGISIKFVMNQNFVVAVDLGKAFN